MRIARLSFVPMLCLIIFGGGDPVEAKGKTWPPPRISERFALTTEPQEAVFTIAIGWTGGMGSMPVLSAKTERLRKMEDLPIFFDRSKEEEVRSKLPGCVSGRPVIKVEARIQLVRRTGRNQSIPGAPQQSYYEATALSAPQFTVWYEPCED